MFTLAKKERLAGYTVTFQIKESDYAETYRVKDAAGKNRFLKLINCAKLHRTQFNAYGDILEIEIVKQLDHPNIVKYRDSGVAIIKAVSYTHLRAHET